MQRPQHGGLVSRPARRTPAGIACCRQALALLAETGDKYGQAGTWDSLGYAYHQSGDHEQATTCYHNAIDLHRQAGDRHNEADALTRLGDNHHAAGRPDAARDSWRRALEILDELDHPDADQVRARAGGVVRSAYVLDGQSCPTLGRSGGDLTTRSRSRREIALPVLRKNFMIASTQLGTASRAALLVCTDRTGLTRSEMEGYRPGRRVDTGILNRRSVMKSFVMKAAMATTAGLAAAAMLPGAAFAAGTSTTCRNSGGVCTVTISHPSRGTVSIDVSSSNTTPDSVQWEIGGAGGYLCVGHVPDNGVVHSYVCSNVPAGTIRAGIFVAGGSTMAVGVRW